MNVPVAVSVAHAVARLNITAVRGFALCTRAHGGRFKQRPQGEALREQVCTRLSKSNVSSGHVLPQPTPFNREGKPRAVFRRAATMAKKKRAVEQLDVNPTVLHWLDSAGDLQQLARGLLG